MSKYAIIGSRGYPSFYGGFETLVRHLAPHLKSEGHDVTVYGHERSTLRVHSEDVHGVEVRYTAGYEAKSTSTLSFGLTATRDALHRHYDAVLVLNVANGFYIRQFRHQKIPTAVNVDGLEWKRGKWSAVAKRTFIAGAKRCAEDANALIFDSRQLELEWRDKFGRGGVFIPYGAPILDSLPSNLIEQYGLIPRSYLLLVCRVVPENNVDLILDAMKFLPEDLPIVVVGDSNYANSTTQRLQDLHHRGSLKWLGHVSNQDLLNQLWCHAAVYWHGHSVGGTNPALLQALGAGSPVLALDTPYNREVLDSDFQLVHADSREISERICDVLYDKIKSKEMVDRGKEIVQTRYSWDSVCHSYSELLGALSSSPGISIN
ncbi:MAG: DUF1972 domain-containing protein [Nitrososphaerales archaeon]